MKLKSKKSALLLSFTSLLLCFAMLAGSTFAWFTDTATTGVNKIVSGNLDIEAYYRTAADVEWAKIDDATDLFGTENTRFEPGHTRVVELKIENAGNLALKYKIGMNIASETAGTNKAGNPYKLSDSLKVATTAILACNTGNPTTDATAEWFDEAVFEKNFSLWKNEQNLGNFELEKTESGTVNQLLPGGEVILGMKIYMPDTVGNEANALTTAQAASITFGLNILATQYIYERDSFSNNYDEDAQYPDVTYMHATENESLKSAIRDSQSSEKPAYIGLSEGSYQVDSTDVIGTGATLAGKGIDKTTLTASEVSVSKDDVTIKDMTIKGDAPAGNDGAMKIGGKNTVIENVKFVGQGMNGDTKGISVTGENLTIRNSNISNAFRGIIFWDNIGGNNVIEDCTIDNVIYTFNINAATVKPGTTLTVKGSTLNGWTSYAGCMTKVSFEKCNLGKSNGYAYLVAYADSDFIDCTFNDGYQVAAGATAGATGKTLTFTNCKLADGTTITADNFAEKLGDVDGNMKSYTVIVDGTTVNWN